MLAAIRNRRKSSSRGGTRTHTGDTPHGILSPDEAPENPEENAPSQNSAAQGAALGAPEGPDDPNLAIIIQRWPDLPPAMKSGILAMVQATGGA